LSAIPVLALTLTGIFSDGTSAKCGHNRDEHTQRSTAANSRSLPCWTCHE
jgi:hypothetical protein